jgi:hypothetical protein
LQPLLDMAAKLDAALLGITHFTKGSEGRSPIDRVTGSVAFGALARVVMVAAKQQDGNDGKSAPRVLMRAKSNIGPDEGGFAYSLELVPMFEWPDIVASVVSWGESRNATHESLMALVARQAVVPEQRQRKNQAAKNQRSARSRPEILTESIDRTRAIHGTYNVSRGGSQLCGAETALRPRRMRPISR